MYPNPKHAPPPDYRRFERLERSVASLVERLDPGNHSDDRSWSQTEHLSDETSAAGYVDSAPVFQIRDAATEVGVGTPATTDISQSPQFSRRTTDSIDTSTARSLLEMWVVLSLRHGYELTSIDSKLTMADGSYSHQARLREQGCRKSHNHHYFSAAYT